MNVHSFTYGKYERMRLSQQRVLDLARSNLWR